MKIFKFGGASVNTVERIRNVSTILSSYTEEKILIVISAIGKTTNALEEVVRYFVEGDNQSALTAFGLIKEEHLRISAELLGDAMRGNELLAEFFTEVEWLLHDKPVREYDYYYDQVVCIGELLSTSIVAEYLIQSGFNLKWVDVRDILRTDNTFRDANVQWEFSSRRINEDILPLFGEADMILTQGFIGATDENESTTLGREGSDYTAAIFASMLNAKNLTIWKDVKGVMNADPKKYSDTIIIDELNYEEVIEMAFYGAQVIHPKTIQPLQNKSIPLHVKSFLDPSLPGTIIHNSKIKGLPPIVVVKEKQVLVHLRSRDFTFVSEKPLADLYQLLMHLKIKPNLVQTAAIHVSICLDDAPDKIERLALEASDQFDVLVEKGLQLLTVRHYKADKIEQLVNGRDVQLRQQTKEIIQMVLK